jgi:hypothetical protein
VALLSIAATIINSLAMTDRASGVFFTGNALYGQCTIPGDEVRVGCMAYVMGVLDAAAAEANFAEVRQSGKPQPDRPYEETLSGFRWCPSTAMKDRQVLDIVMNFLRDNLADRGYDAPGLIAKAMQQAWPCLR